MMCSAENCHSRYSRRALSMTFIGHAMSRQGKEKNVKARWILLVEAL